MRLVLLALSILLLGGAQAQTAPAARDKIYQVDILLFERPLARDRFPARKPDWPDYSQARPLLPADITLEPALAPPLAPEQAHPPFWQLLPEEQQGLQAEARRLQRSARYTVLARFSWVQPVVPRQAQQPVRLRPPPREDVPDESLLTLDFPREHPREAEQVQPPRLDGQASLYKGSYLHLKLDIGYCKPGFPRSLGLEPDCWRLQQDYRVKPGKLYYYDHRHFGALARIRLLNEDSASKPAMDP